MKRASIAKSCFLLFLSFSLSGCNEIAQIVTPTCSDEATLALVRQIISENIVEASDQLSPEELKKRLTFSLVHATKLEENIHKYTCEATLIASNGIAQHKISLEYESQLDDARAHLVQVLNLTNSDAFAMKPILMAEKTITMESPSAEPVPSLTPSKEPEVSQSDTSTESELDAAALVDAVATDAAAAVEAAANTSRAAAYEKYKVEVYPGPIKMPYFTGDQAKYSDYRTKIREAAAYGVNFAGKYAVAEIGCGAGCRFAYLINLETGKINDFPLGGEENYQLQMRYYPDSSLLFAIWSSGDFETCVGELFVLQNNKLTSLVKRPDKIACEL